jgi:two-component system, NtrC family, response regulator HydG
MPTHPGKILLVDDDQHVLYTARVVLKSHFETVRTESSPSQIRELLSKEHYDVVLLDMNFAPGATSGKEGLHWLKVIRELDPEAGIVMNTAYGDIGLAVEAMKEGATDFLVKPWDKEKLVATMTAVYQLSRANREVTRLKSHQRVMNQALPPQEGEMLSRSPAMQAVLRTVEKVAATDANVLILGENGTGKDLLARLIHRQSGRAGEGFVKVDLGAVAATLFESELFGHVKGAFTDAREDRPGRFEMASGGTLFLDEIGNLPLQLQSKLLTVLQNRVVTRVGSHKAISIDIRLLSATNQPIYQRVAEGDFRQDLLYRINTVEVTLPPLRERTEDIPLLADHFLRLYSRKYGKDGLQLASSTLRDLQQYPWPGNIRELQHAVERAVILGESNQLTTSDFLKLPLSGQPNGPGKAPQSFRVEEVEKHLISEAIRKYQGNLTKAALELGFGRSTLYRKMEKYGLS